MYLSRLELNGRSRRVQADLRDCQALDRTGRMPRYGSSSNRSIRTGLSRVWMCPSTSSVAVSVVAMCGSNSAIW